MKLYYLGLLIFIQIGLLPILAHADTSVSSDAGRRIENGQSDTIKRDKSLSTDKTQGNKISKSASQEKSTEKSKNHSKSKKTTKSANSVKSNSVDVNINGLLIREFTARYELDGTGSGLAGSYFWVCKPLTRALADYPTLYWGPDPTVDALFNKKVAQRNFAGQLEILSRGSIGGLGHYHKEVIGRNLASQLYMREGNISRPSLNTGTFSHYDLFYSRYVQCRMTASYWVAEAGQRAAAQIVRTEADASSRINQVFIEMDADDSLFQKLRQRARILWEQESCSKTLQDLNEFKSPDIQCGVFSYVGNTFTVENRETLSEASIDGRSYKISVSASAGDTVAEDDSVSSDDKVSSTNKKGESTDSYRENKKTASMNKSKSLDQNNSSKVDRSTGNSVNAAAPKD